MIFIDSPRNPHDNSSRILIPVWRPQPRESRHHIASMRVRNLLRHIFCIFRSVNQFQFVPQPLNRRPSHKNRAFQGVGNFSVQPPGDRSNQTIFRKDRFISGIHQQKAAGAIRIFSFSGLKTGLTEQSGLLISRRASNGNRRAKIGRIGFSVDTAGRLYLRKHTFRNIQLPQNLLIPLKRPDIKH